MSRYRYSTDSVKTRVSCNMTPAQLQKDTERCEYKHRIKQIPSSRSNHPQECTACLVMAVVILCGGCPPKQKPAPAPLLTRFGGASSTSLLPFYASGRERKKQRNRIKTVSLDFLSLPVYPFIPFFFFYPVLSWPSSDYLSSQDV